jgi:DHA2 family metal-tetracycline-proton antiporter-like MFS transporter
MFTKKHYCIIITVSLAVFITNLDMSIVNIALPTLAKDFNVDTGVVSRILITYLLAYCGLLLPFGSLSDIKGTVKIFKLGLVVFTVSSLLCGISSNINMLIIFRFIQGIGGSMLLSTFGSIIIQYLPPEGMGRVFGLMSIFGGGSIAIGAPLGGFIIRYLPWHWLFFINIPIGIIALILASLNLDSKEKPAKEQTFDLKGSILSFSGLILFLYALNSGGERGWTSPFIIGSFMLAFIFLICFVIIEKNHKNPLLDINLFRNIYFSLGLLANLIACIILDGSNFIFPFYFELVRGFTSDKAGLLLMLFPILIVFVGPVAGFLSDRIDPRIMSTGGMVFIMIASFFILSFNSLTSLSFIIISFLIMGAGFALFFTTNPVVVLSHAPENREGIVNAINSFDIYLGSTLGICIFELIFSMSFSGNITNTGSVDGQNILRGLHNVFIFVSIISLTGVIASVIAKKAVMKKTVHRSSGRLL